MQRENVRPIGEIISDILPKYLATHFGPGIEEQPDNRSLAVTEALWPTPTN